MDIQLVSQLVLPAIVGGLAGFAAFYFQWDVEKRRAKLARRSALVDAWRTNLLEYWPKQDGVMVIPPGGLPVCSHPDYASLRPHLSEPYRERIEGAQTRPMGAEGAATVVVGYNTLRMEMMSEIARIERAWGLV